MTPEEVREVQLHTLVKFSQWCEAKGLRYQLAFGSLLGAVRHQGFIPWDDDIDLAMPRPDYERLCREFQSDAPDHLVIGSLASVGSWPLPYAKVWDSRTVVEEHTNLPLSAGVGLDVFPVDDVPAPGVRQSAHLLLSRAARSLETLSSVRHRAGRSALKTVILTLAGPLSRALGAHRIAVMRTRVATLVQAGASHASVLVGPYTWSTARSGMIATTSVLFEGLHLPAPIDASAVLTSIYGDYMTPPDPDRQVAHHVASASWASGR